MRGEYFDDPLNKKFFLKLFSLIGTIIAHTGHDGHGRHELKSLKLILSSIRSTLSFLKIQK